MKQIRIGDITIDAAIEREGRWRRPQDFFPTYEEATFRHHGGRRSVQLPVQARLMGQMGLTRDNRPAIKPVLRDRRLERGRKMRKSCIAALIAIGTTISLPAWAADEGRAKMMQAAALAVRLVTDNERVTVWDTAGSLPAAAHDFVAISLVQPGNAVFGRAGDTVGTAGSRTVIVELKDHPVAAIPNNSGYPNAFPRPHIEKILENDRVIVWRYRWNLGEPTPMHFHDKDVVVVYLEDTALKSTEPDGKNVLNEYKAADIRFNRRDRVHTELLVRDTGSAVITELK